MDAIFEYNSWFVAAAAAAMSGDECDQETEEEPDTLVARDNGSCHPHQVMRTSLLQRSSSFYDTEACANLLEIEDEIDSEEDPSLTDTSVDYSEEDMSTDNSLEEDSCCQDDSTTTTRRHLTFNPKVTIREYSITVGDHPLCHDAFPLSLDWSHAPEYCTDIVQSKSRGYRYQPPRVLGLQERRQRLVQVADYAVETLDARNSFPTPHHHYFVATELSLAKRMLNRLQQSLLRMESRLLDAVSMEAFEGEEESDEFIWSGEIGDDELDEIYKDNKDDFVLVWEQNPY